VLRTTPLLGGLVKRIGSRGSWVATGSAGWGRVPCRSARNEGRSHRGRWASPGDVDVASPWAVGADLAAGGLERTDRQAFEPAGAGSPGANRRRAIANKSTPSAEVSDQTWIALSVVRSNIGLASDPAAAPAGSTGPPAGSEPPGPTAPGPGPTVPGGSPGAIAPTPAEAAGSDDGLDGAAGAVDTVGEGFGLDFVTGFAVGRGVGFGAGFGAGLGFGFVMTTRLGETAVSVTDRAPAPLPLEAVKR
jgi:hypothetical protein